MFTLVFVVGSAQSTPPPTQPSLQKGVSSLEGFLQAFEQLPKDIKDGMLAQTKNADEQRLIGQLGDALVEEIGSLTNYMRQRSEGVSGQQKNDVENLLTLSTATSLLGRAQTISKDLASPVMKIGLGGILKKIKKLLPILLPLLGIPLPPGIIDTILDLIDEDFNLLASVGSPSLAHTLSVMEQDYLGELTNLTMLKKVSEMTMMEDLTKK
jgi:hypothetical protein